VPPWCCSGTACLGAYVQEGEERHENEAHSSMQLHGCRSALLTREISYMRNVKFAVTSRAHETL